MRVILDSLSDVRLHDQLDSYCLDRRMSDHDESVALERKLAWRSGRGGLLRETSVMVKLTGCRI